MQRWDEKTPPCPILDIHAAVGPRLIRSSAACAARKGAVVGALMVPDSPRVRKQPELACPALRQNGASCREVPQNMPYFAAARFKNVANFSLAHRLRNCLRSMGHAAEYGATARLAVRHENWVLPFPTYRLRSDAHAGQRHRANLLRFAAARPSRLGALEPKLPNGDPLENPQPLPDYPTDVPVPEPHDVPAWQPIDVPPPSTGEPDPNPRPTP